MMTKLTREHVRALAEAFKDIINTQGTDQQYTSEELQGASFLEAHEALRVFEEEDEIIAYNESFIPPSTEGGFRQTYCRYCALDVEGEIGKSDWRDRGNNPTCQGGANVGKPHDPVL